MKKRLFLTELSLFQYEHKNGKINVLSFGAPFAYFATILSGYAEITSEDGKTVLSVQPGELFYIPKGCRYTSRWYGNPSCRFYSLRFLFDSEDENRFYSLQKIPLSEEEAIDETFFQREGWGDAERLSEFYRFYAKCSKKMIPAQKPSFQPSVKAALVRLENEPKLPCDVPTLAGLCCMSEPSFYRHFRAETGKTPMEYKNTLICQRAAYLLATTDQTVEEIADTVGCSTASYLRRLFRQIWGQSPVQVRKKSREI